MKVLSQGEIDNLLAGLLKDVSILPTPPASEAPKTEATSETAQPATS